MNSTNINSTWHLKLVNTYLQVELHVHLDGSMRRETLFELLKVKNLPCPGDGSFQAFVKAIEVTHPKDLQRFLSAFPKFMPAVQ